MFSLLECLEQKYMAEILREGQISVNSGQIKATVSGFERVGKPYFRLSFRGSCIGMGFRT